MSSSALTEPALVNISLTMLGQQPIAALTESTNRAVMANARYADCRDTVLRAHPWNCAIKRASCTKLSRTPTYGYSNTFSVPADFVRMVDLEDPTQRYAIEAGNAGDTDSGHSNTVIVSDATEMKIRYIYRVTAVNLMDDTLKHAIATKLAADLALALTGDSGKEQFLIQKFQQILMQAQWEDSVQHNTTETIHGGLWLEARYDNAVYRDYPNLNSDGSLA